MQTDSSSLTLFFNTDFLSNLVSGDGSKAVFGPATAGERQGFFLSSRLIHGEICPEFRKAFNLFLTRKSGHLLKDSYLDFDLKKFSDGRKYYCRVGPVDWVVRFYEDQRIYLAGFGQPVALRELSDGLSLEDQIFQGKTSFRILEKSAADPIIQMIFGERVLSIRFSVFEKFYQLVQKHKPSSFYCRRLQYDLNYQREALQFLRYILKLSLKHSGWIDQWHVRASRFVLLIEDEQIKPNDYWSIFTKAKS